jgi:hypothetical protein
MNRQYFTFLIFIFVTCNSWAQESRDNGLNKDSYIINTTVYKKGVYATFEEFKFNNPSITSDLTFTKKRVNVLDSKTGQYKKLKNRNVWGFCNGEKIFVQRNKYNEITLLGRYCYFKEEGVRVASFMGSFPVMLLPIPMPYKDELIINFNTGKVYLLTKDVMKTIFRTDDPELLKEFAIEKAKKDKYYDYIVKYNQRNTDKIK